MENDTEHLMCVPACLAKSPIGDAIQLLRSHIVQKILPKQFQPMVPGDMPVAEIVARRY